MYQNSLEELQDAEVSVEAKNQEIDEKIKYVSIYKYNEINLS